MPPSIAVFAPPAFRSDAIALWYTNNDMVYFDLYDLLITAHPPKRTVMTMLKPDSIDAYIAGFPETVQEKLKQMRDTIRKAAPGAEESISYGIAGFTLYKRPLVYFAGAKKHMDCMRRQPGTKSSRTNFLSTRQGKAPYSSRLKSRCRWS